MIIYKNIYYMLSYAFRNLNNDVYKSIETEEFDSAFDLFASILTKGVSVELKRGLAKDYVHNSEELATLKGRININESIKTLTMLNHKLVCDYDEFSEDIYPNQILKTTLELLLHKDVAKDRKKDIRNILLYFSNVKTLDYHFIDWNIKYSKNNQNYRMLIAICNLVINSFLQSERDGNTKVMNFLDDQFKYRLYEKFILEYYKKEFKDIRAEASFIDWAVDDGNTLMLPVMKSDITLTKGNKVLIIDAKYYSKNVQTNYETIRVISGNMYQIFTYVKNKKEALPNCTVSGMLLYAKTDDLIQPDNSYKMSGDTISVKTLDLNSDFSLIKERLNSFVEEYL